MVGDSIGKWEGDTLVVDTVGLNDRTWLDTAAMSTATNCISSKNSKDRQ